MNAARPLAPLRVSPKVIELNGAQRLIYSSLRREARRPTVRLSYRALAGCLLLASLTGLVTGWWLR